MMNTSKMKLAQLAMLFCSVILFAACSDKEETKDVPTNKKEEAPKEERKSYDKKLLTDKVWSLASTPTTAYRFKSDGKVELLGLENEIIKGTQITGDWTLVKDSLTFKTEASAEPQSYKITKLTDTKLEYERVGVAFVFNKIVPKPAPPVKNLDKTLLQAKIWIDQDFKTRGLRFTEAGKVEVLKLDHQIVQESKESGAWANVGNELTFKKDVGGLEQDYTVSKLTHTEFEFSSIGTTFKYKLAAPTKRDFLIGITWGLSAGTIDGKSIDVTNQKDRLDFRANGDLFDGDARRPEKVGTWELDETATTFKRTGWDAETNTPKATSTIKILELTANVLKLELISGNKKYHMTYSPIVTN